MIPRRTLLLATRPTAAGLKPAIRPRIDWAGETRRARGPLLPEREPLFLLVHHTDSPTPKRRAQVPPAIRGFFDYHTGPKGWSDVAYNFLVDPFGEVWEGRTGSIATPIRGDATGGSQGHAELVCFIGSFTHEPPSAPALDAAARLLAWLATRDNIDLSIERAIRFTSRGSNRWPRGANVTTWPIAGHREMSLTTCPGDALFPLVRQQLLPTARSIAVDATEPVSASPSPTSGGTSATPIRSTTPDDGGASVGQPLELPWGVGLGLTGLAAGGAWYLRRRRSVDDRPIP